MHRIPRVIVGAAIAALMLVSPASAATRRSSALPAEATPGYRLGVAVLFVEAVQVDAYLDALDSYFQAVVAASHRSGGRRAATYGGVGDCTGFVIPDYIIQRESNGNPAAENPSGAYGCAQTLRSHYRDGGTCAGLTPEVIDDQRECVRRLSNDGTNLAPWSETA